MENFSEWFHNILEEAEIIDSRYPIKGMSVWLPNGFKIRKYTLDILRKLLDKNHDEVLFPLLIPEEELAKEGMHVKGFEEEVYWVTHGGQSELNEKLAIRPTSETAMYPMFKLWIRSHIDLPMRFYQIVNTFRYETKHTRPLIRVREITTFEESHTVHGTKEEAAAQVNEAITIYKEFFDSLGIPYIISDRPVWDKFPGADYTIAFDALLPDGKTLQIGTVHNLGTTFAKTFDIKYENANGEHKYVYQCCYGLSDRVIASVIGIHGDEKGLKLPPIVATYQVVITPVIFKKGGKAVMTKCIELKVTLEKAGLRVLLDDRDIRPGKKYYESELKGIPIRLELGPRDLENNQAVAVRRDTNQKVQIQLDGDFANNINNEINDIDNKMKIASKKSLMNRIVPVDSIEAIEETINGGNVASFTWCGEEECGKDIEEKINFDILGSFQADKVDYKIETKDMICPNCGKEGRIISTIAKTY